VVLIDSREQDPLDVGRFLPVLPASLYSGDYSVLGFEHELSIERKSIADLTGSLAGGRERFEHELLRLRGMRFKRLLIVGSPSEIELHRYRSKITPASVFGSLATYEARFDLPTVWEPCPFKAARLVARWAYYWHRELVRAFEKVKSCTIDHAAGSSVLQLAD
jgi:ERCC4-type nuclease